MSLEIKQGPEGETYRVSAKGEVDLNSSPQLRDAILKAVAATKNPVGIDLSAVDYMDSSGVATLVEGFQASRAKQQDFVLVAPSHSVMKVLQLARLETLFDIRESL